VDDLSRVDVHDDVQLVPVPLGRAAQFGNVGLRS
jgi:hypothetical protein